MFPGAKIVVVDDDSVHLEAVISALRKLGLACLSYHYPDERPAVDTSFGGIRLVVIDINLVGGTSPGNDHATLGPPASLIDRIISAENGPYALVTWSTTDLHDALIQRMRHQGFTESRMPFFSVPLAKADFLDDPDGFKDEIKSLLTKNPPFGAILDWERRVSRAAERVLFNIHDISGRFSGGEAAERMDRALSRLAVNAFGQANVADHRFEATNEALMPILTDAVNSELFSAEDRDIWEKAVTKHGEKFTLDAAAISKLNTAVNLEVSSDVKPHRRGAILEVPEAWLNDDEFERRFGSQPKRLRGDLLKLTEPKTPRWVLVQVQAACDFSQGNVGTIPYFLAAVVPMTRVRMQKDGADLKLPASVWQSPPFDSVLPISTDSFALEILTGVAYPMTRKTIEESKFKVIGRLKDQIVSSIAYQGNTNGSRPGYISFR
ncbi:hypothetical protein [Bradyrhizobium sp. ORS 86]|uniref:hypothetical protein n=1 Tax=Bradyrhizobium sp. ORS 86 TaxID=1685970 RepID=UPI003890A4AB